MLLLLASCVVLVFFVAGLLLAFCISCWILFFFWERVVFLQLEVTSKKTFTRVGLTHRVDSTEKGFRAPPGLSGPELWRCDASDAARNSAEESGRPCFRWNFATLGETRGVHGSTNHTSKAERASSQNSAPCQGVRRWGASLQPIDSSRRPTDSRDGLCRCSRTALDPKSRWEGKDCSSGSSGFDGRGEGGPRPHLQPRRQSSSETSERFLERRGRGHDTSSTAAISHHWSLLPLDTWRALYNLAEVRGNEAPQFQLTASMASTVALVTPLPWDVLFAYTSALSTTKASWNSRHLLRGSQIQQQHAESFCCVNSRVILVLCKGRSSSQRLNFSLRTPSHEWFAASLFVDLLWLSSWQIPPSGLGSPTAPACGRFRSRVRSTPRQHS